MRAGRNGQTDSLSDSKAENTKITARGSPINTDSVRDERESERRMIQRANSRGRESKREE